MESPAGRAGIPLLPLSGGCESFNLFDPENILSAKIMGTNKLAKPGNMAGIGFLVFEK